MPTNDQLQQQIDGLKKRNLRVEADKAWETSWTRRIIIFVFTYLVMVIFFYFAELANPFKNAVVPSIAFVISTLSIPIIKKWWLNR